MNILTFFVLRPSYQHHIPCDTHRTAMTTFCIKAPIVPELHGSFFSVLLLQVLAVVNVSAAMTNDVHSLRVATSTLASVVPAWLSAGKDLTALWGAVVDALPSLPPHRRLGLLGALLGATPALESLPVALLLLLKAATQALLGPAAAVEAKGQEVSRHDWLLDLAAQLCLQVCCLMLSILFED